MEQIYLIAALWLALAVVSAIVAYHLKVSIALIEICVGVAAAAVANKYFGPNALGSNSRIRPSRGNDVVRIPGVYYGSDYIGKRDDC